MKVLFISPYPREGASARLRIYQYAPFLEKEGIALTIRPFFFGRFYAILYAKGHRVRKILYFFVASLLRLGDMARALRYDVVFIHRESYPIGPCFFEFVLKKILRKKIIFDFDDAIFLPNVSKTNKFMGALKWPIKIRRIIALSDVVIAGNEYLKKFAAQYNKRVEVMMTPVDTRAYRPRQKTNSGVVSTKVVIGWIGSPTTSQFLHTVVAPLKRLMLDFPSVEFLLVGAERDEMLSSLPRIRIVPWSLPQEKELLSQMDIGIMPMPDDQWTKGKCGFKAILYMSMGIPVVCSKVGVNTEVVKDGVTGFTVEDDAAWYEKLARLVKDAPLREAMGNAAWHDCEERFSLEDYAKKLIGIIQNLS